MIEVNKIAKCLQVLLTLSTSVTQKPDITISLPSTGILLVQIESGGNAANTIRKLQYQLAEQLRWQRNSDTDITTCTGFFFPCKNNYYVVEVKVEWIESTICFRVKHRKALKPGDVIQRIQAI